MLINSVNVELLSRESIKAALKQDPVLSQVVDWLKTGVKPARCEHGRRWAQTSCILVTVGKTAAQGWSGIETLEKRKDRPRDLPADLFAGKLCASSVACPL